MEQIKEYILREDLDIEEDPFFPKEEKYDRSGEGEYTYINKKVADTPYPFFTLMPAHGRRICNYNMDGELVR